MSKKTDKKDKRKQKQYHSDNISSSDINSNNTGSNHTTEYKVQKVGTSISSSLSALHSGTFELYRQWDLLPELAMEAHDLLRGDHGGEIPGVELTEEVDGLASIHTVTIRNSQGSRIMQKPEGTYVTIYSNELAVNHHGMIETLTELLTKHLQKFIQLPSLQEPVLVAGLGNWKSTPDSLGPRVINQLMATRHLHGNVPDEILEGVRPVTTIAPGVLGMTGIESSEIIHSIAKQVKPKLIIVIDALAAGDVSRIGTTIQISNTGIAPGAGVGNHRRGINEQTMGVPVISIGIPTVVKARIIAHNILEEFWNQLLQRPQLREVLQQLPPPTIHRMMQNALEPCHNQLEVTPKEIDDLMQNCSAILSRAITRVLHPDMNEDFAASFF